MRSVAGSWLDGMERRRVGRAQAGNMRLCGTRSWTYGLRGHSKILSIQAITHRKPDRPAGIDDGSSKRKGLTGRKNPRLGIDATFHVAFHWVPGNGLSQAQINNSTPREERSFQVMIKWRPINRMDGQLDRLLSPVGNLTTCGWKIRCALHGDDIQTDSRTLHENACSRNACRHDCANKPDEPATWRAHNA